MSNQSKYQINPKLTNAVNGGLVSPFLTICVCPFDIVEILVKNN